MIIVKLSRLMGLGAVLALAGTGSASAATTPSDGTMVSFTGTGGTAISGVLYRPDNYTANSNWPAVVMLHGCSGMWSNSIIGSTNADGSPNLQRHIESWGRYLADHGYYALAVDSFAAHGDSQNQCNTTETNPYTQRPGDARSAHAFLVGTGRVNAQKVGMLGWSQGAQAAMVEAAETELMSNTTRTNHLFAATAVFYPGCGGNMEFGDTVSASYWRPHANFRMNMGEKDGFKTDCNTRIMRARTVYGSTAGSGHEAKMVMYRNSGHSFDFEARAGKPDTWFPPSDDMIGCSIGSASAYCDMTLADWGTLYFLDSHLM